MEKFGKYELVRKIGTGGMADIYLARTAVAHGLAKHLVIKKIQPSLAKTQQFVSMFVHEARIALDLNHPNLVQVFDFGTVNDTCFLGMEFVDGLDLLRLVQEAVRQGKRIPIGYAAYIAQEIAKGLDYAHRKKDDFGQPLNIVHRDISLQNILLSWEGAVKIVDFGVARTRDINEEQGVIKGKFAYMSPEQARGSQVDHRSDIFSAGIVLFELLTRRALFEGNGRAVLDKVKAGAITPPTAIEPDIPQSLEDIVLKALAFHRDDRYQTARDLGNALREFRLSHSHLEQEFIDSASLARWLAHTISPEARAEHGLAAPVAARDESEEQTAISLADEKDSGLTGIMPNRGTSVRERRHILIIEGLIRGENQLRHRVGDEAVGQRLQRFHRLTRDIVARHNIQLHYNDNDRITCIVGVPTASENDTVRALECALHLIDGLDTLSDEVEPLLRLSVGVEQGIATVKPDVLGKFSYELSPSSGSMARELARHAHVAEVLVGSRVYRLANSEWKFDEIVLDDTELTAPAPAGAIRAARRVYRLQARRSRQERLKRSAAVFVGRTNELAQLERAYRDVAEHGTRRMLAVLGDDGVGKRSLIREFLTLLKPPAHCIKAAARIPTAYTPLAVVADVVRDHLNISEGTAATEARKRITTAVERRYRQHKEAWTSSLRALLGVLDDDEKAVQAGALRDRLLQIICRIASHAKDLPLVLVLENAHWADRDSLELYRQFMTMPQEGAVLAIMTARPNESLLRWHAPSDIMRIGELPKADAHRLALSRLEGVDDGDKLAEQIIRRSGGNPLFTHEIIDTLIDRGVLAIAGEAQQLSWVDRDADIQIPSSIESALAARIDRLPSSEKHALLRAAVLGRNFSARRVDALLGQDASHALQQLVDRELLDKDDTGFIFHNEMTMRVAYSMIPTKERITLHRLAAKTLREAEHFQRGWDDAVVARHLELAEDLPAAARHYIAAATHADHVGSYNDAIRLLERALRIAPEDDVERRYLAYKALCRALGAAGDTKQELEKLHELRRQAEAMSTPSTLAEAQLLLAAYHLRHDRPAIAATSLDTAKNIAATLASKTLNADISTIEAAIANRIGNHDLAIKICNAALEACGKERDVLPRRAKLLRARGQALMDLGAPDKAIESFAETLVIHRLTTNTREETRALADMASVFAELGEYEEALAHYRAATELARNHGSRRELASYLAAAGVLYAEIGSFSRANSLLSEAHSFVVELDNAPLNALVACARSQAMLWRGDVSSARQLLDDIRDYNFDNRNDHFEAQLVRARADLILKAPIDEVRSFVAGLEGHSKFVSAHLQVGYLLISAELANALGDDKSAREYYDRALSQHVQSGRKRRLEFTHYLGTQIYGEHDLNKARELITGARQHIERQAAQLRDPALTRRFWESPAVQRIANDYRSLCGQDWPRPQAVE